MSLAGYFRSFKKFPIFDGYDYPFWKEKMKIRLKAIDDDMWQVVENGYVIKSPGCPTLLEKRLVQMHARANDVICNHLTIMPFIHFRRLDSMKEI